MKNKKHYENLQFKKKEKRFIIYKKPLINYHLFIIFNNYLMKCNIDEPFITIFRCLSTEYQFH